MLNFERVWRFDSPGNFPNGALNEVSKLIGRVAGQANQERQSVLEHFKDYFADAAGFTSGRSSSASWAETDLYSYLRQAAENAPLFIEAFYDACLSITAKHPSFMVPELARINRILLDHDTGYEIRPPDLVCTTAHEQVPVVAQPPSLDEQAQDIYQRSLKQSELLLSEGRNRPAVQEILWLLETISTAFQGLEIATGTVQGKYFNKIVSDLRKHYKGQLMDRVLDWVTTLHGYLSSPTGGGIRHGTNIKAATDMDTNEARLFCNLIRSYISFLVAEHARLRGGAAPRARLAPPEPDDDIPF